MSTRSTAASSASRITSRRRPRRPRRNRKRRKRRRPSKSLGTIKSQPGRTFFRAGGCEALECASRVPDTEKYLAFRKHLRTLDLMLLAVGIWPAAALAQQPITRQQAIDAAVSRGARAAVARADTLVGAAGVISARQWENPSLSLTYSKSVPTYHEILDIPLDLSGARSARIGA